MVLVVALVHAFAATASIPTFDTLRAQWLKPCNEAGRRGALCKKWADVVDTHLSALKRGHSLARAELLEHGDADKPINKSPRRAGTADDVLDMFNATWSCASKEEMPPPRPGLSHYERQKHGAKWMCGLGIVNTYVATQSGPPCRAYSFGSEGRTGWEQSIKERLPNCSIWTFDPTMTRKAVAKVREVEARGVLTFTELGLVGGADVMWGDRGAISRENATGRHGLWGTTLPAIQSRLGHTEPPTFLKVDIETSEFGVVLQSHTCPRAAQLQIEVHTIRSTPREVYRFFEILAHCGYAVFSKDRVMRNCVELAWMSPAFAFAEWIKAKRVHGVD